MKKVSLLCAALLAASMSVHASDIDLSSMSIEELVNLRTQINQIIYEEDTDVMPWGIFEVGKHIKAGTYKITSMYEVKDDGKKAEVYVQDDEGHFVIAAEVERGEEMEIVLEDGYTLTTIRGMFVIKESEKPFWAP